MRKNKIAFVGLLATILLMFATPPRVASAFCGFYVSGADAKLFNDATQVALMRHGNRTVLSMQNAYKGPPQDFAMVVPVPVVLQKENVKTLKKELFDKLDKLSSPRLVEYWEQDPCAMAKERDEMKDRQYEMSAKSGSAPPAGAAKDLGVKIEAQFTVGEYDIVVLSAEDSGGLDTWLRREKYKIPEGAEPYLKPYVQAGSKFFVARVDSKKITIDRQTGIADLSPLRFHYDTNEFALPVRLGLINSAGTQDLIIHILSLNDRYQPANYPSVTIPTNLDVTEEVAKGNRFGAFYAALFDRTIAKFPKAIVTEYAWTATGCDPCPGPVVDAGDLTSLGADAMPTLKPDEVQYGNWVLTRLHARYAKAALGADIIFKTAPAIVGGREFLQNDSGHQLEHGAIEQPGGGQNNFQARYAVRHAWTGKLDCDRPLRGIWGGPPNAGGGGGGSQPVAATKLAFVARDPVDLPKVVRSDAPEIGLLAGGPKAVHNSMGGGDMASNAPRGCFGCTTSSRTSPSWFGYGMGAALLMAIGLRLRRARQSSRVSGS